MHAATKWLRDVKPVVGLTVAYDDDCALCLRTRQWMERQPALVPLRFAPGWSLRGTKRFRSIPWVGAELVVVSDDGRVWAGPAAFIMCLWALRDYRQLAMRLSRPGNASLARLFFTALSKERKRIAAMLGPSPCASDSCSATTPGRFPWSPPQQSPYR